MASVNEENGTPCSGGGCLDGVCDPSLPIELTDFYASVEGDRVLLTWHTASETNNAGFEIQQHQSGCLYTTLDFVDGAGTTIEAKNYRYVIEDMEPQTYRFRLKQIDYDGSFSYSPIIEVAIALSQAHLMTLPYPNPSSGQTQFSLMVKRAQPVTVEIYDMLGRRVAVLHDGLVNAEQAIAFVFDAAPLSSGRYVIQAKGETFASTQHLIVTK